MEEKGVFERQPHSSKHTSRHRRQQQCRQGGVADLDITHLDWLLSRFREGACTYVCTQAGSDQRYFCIPGRQTSRGASRRERATPYIRYCGSRAPRAGYGSTISGRKTCRDRPSLIRYRPIRVPLKSGHSLSCSRRPRRLELLHTYSYMVPTGTQLQNSWLRGNIPIFQYSKSRPVGEPPTPSKIHHSGSHKHVDLLLGADAPGSP